jgi:hypothetical protein
MGAAGLLEGRVLVQCLAMSFVSDEIVGKRAVERKGSEEREARGMRGMRETDVTVLSITTFSTGFAGAGMVGVCGEEMAESEE